MNTDASNDKNLTGELRPSWPSPENPSIRRALDRVFETGDWGKYHGDECAALEAELSQLHENREVCLCSSGTVAVELALRAVGVAQHDEVILAGYDFPGNFRAVEAIGARPVIVDLSDAGWTLCPDALKQAHSKRVKAVIVSHLHGTLAGMAEIQSWAHAMGVAVVEDACQAPGGAINGKVVGTHGDVGVLSFGGSKLLTAGRGGAVLCGTPQQRQRIRIFAERGNDAFPLSELQAAVLRAQLPQLSQDNETRWQNAKRLYSLTSGIGALVAPSFQENVRPVFYKLGWWLDLSNEPRNHVGDRLAEPDANSARNEIIAQLKNEGLAIDAGFRGFAERSSRRCRSVGSLANSRRAAHQTLILHHPILLQPPNVIESVAEILYRVLAK